MKVLAAAAECRSTTGDVCEVLLGSVQICRWVKWGWEGCGSVALACVWPRAFGQG